MYQRFHENRWFKGNHAGGSSTTAPLHFEAAKSGGEKGGRGISNEPAKRRTRLLSYKSSFNREREEKERQKEKVEKRKETPPEPWLLVRLISRCFLLSSENNVEEEEEEERKNALDKGITKPITNTKRKTIIRG